MDEPTPRSRFRKSPHHAWLGAVALAVGFAVAGPTVLSLLVGGALYALGWIYLPDSKMFRRWLDARAQGAEQAAAAETEAAFAKRRDAMVAALSPRRRQLLVELIEVTRDVERAHREGGLSPGGEADDPRIHKLEELIWTYLRLLSFEESLQQFLERERKEDVPRHLREAEEEAARTERDAAELAARGGGPNLETRQRLAASCRERVQVLWKRAQRIEQAQENLAVASAELARIVQQVKLIRADAVATRNAEGLSIRIDATVEQLGETSRWLSQIEDFRDVVGDGPPPGMRVGEGISRAVALHPAPPVPAPPLGTDPRRPRLREEER